MEKAHKKTVFLLVLSNLAVQKELVMDKSIWHRDIKKDQKGHEKKYNNRDRM